MKRPSLRAPVAAALAALLLSAGCRSAAPVPATSRPAPPPSLARYAGLSIVCLEMGFARRGDASGFYVAPALVATCDHAVSGRLPLAAVVRGRGEDQSFIIERVVAHDAASDLALLAVAAEDKFPPPLPLSDSEPKPGERLWAVTRFGVTEAVIVGPHEDPEVGHTLLVSCPGLRKGASGGALLDAGGAVVGVIRGAVDNDPEQVVAVPAVRLRALLAE